jgi:hypothetical protein
LISLTKNAISLIKNRDRNSKSPSTRAVYPDEDVKKACAAGYFANLEPKVSKDLLIKAYPFKLSGRADDTSAIDNMEGVKLLKYADVLATPKYNENCRFIKEIEEKYPEYHPKNMPEEEPE